MFGQVEKPSVSREKKMVLPLSTFLDVSMMDTTVLPFPYHTHLSPFFD